MRLVLILGLLLIVGCSGQATAQQPTNTVEPTAAPDYEAMIEAQADLIAELEARVATLERRLQPRPVISIGPTLSDRVDGLERDVGNLERDVQSLESCVNLNLSWC